MLRPLFPVLLLTPPLLTWAMVRGGIDPPLAMTVVVIALIAIVFLLEQLWPRRAAWNKPGRAVLVTDAVYIALASLPDRITRIAIEAAAVAVAMVAGTPSITTHLSGGEGAVRVIAAFLLADLGKYAIHRFSHHHSWLWRFHQTHHLPERLSVMNALRLHPVNMAYNAAIDTVFVVALGVSPQAAAVLAAIRATVGILQHANLDLDGGRQWLINAPSLHIIHHHVDSQQAGHNFGSTLLVWDRLFGTWAQSEAASEVGVAAVDHRVPNGYLGQLVYPFCGHRLDTTCWLARFSWALR